MPGPGAQEWSQTPLLVRWLIATRASVLPLTLFAVVFAVCLAPPRGIDQWFIAVAAMVALMLAHATNNLINDYVDFVTGLDRDDYFRTRYGVHVLQSGLLSRRQHLSYLVVTGVLAMSGGAGVCLYSGGLSYLFAGAGAFFLVFYTYPLKRLALGEVAVWLTWGPLMVGGVAVAISAAVHADVLWAGAIYGLGPAVVIFAKHTDKAGQDAQRGVLTIPVILGSTRTRKVVAGLAGLQVAGAWVVAIYFDLFGMLAIVFAIPAWFRLANVLRNERPETPPDDYPEHAWPLWYTTYGFLYARDAGLCLILGMLIQRGFGI